MMVEHAGFDAPSILDWTSDELFGTARNDFPASFVGGVKPIWDQGLQELTRMACTRYGLGHVFIGQGVTEFDCLEFWKRYLAVKPIAEEVGATIQSALSQGRSEGLIGGHYTVSTIEQAKTAIYRGHYIYTGSLDGDWALVRRTRKYGRIEGKKNGHIFCIIGYDKDGFYCVNSYGEDNGLFYMENSYWETLYSKNAIMIDPKLAQQTQQEKDNESKRLAYKYVMSDARPQDFATREELAIIFGRFIQQFHPDKK